MVIYYSPFGGLVMGVLNEADPDYEAALVRNGQTFKKARAEGSAESAEATAACDGRCVYDEATKRVVRR